MQKEKVKQLLFTKWIPSLLRLTFTSSLYLLYSTGFSQTDTTFSKTKTYENSSAPDTVIIERIKVQKEKIYIVKRDTVVQTDTINKTIFQKDTILIYQDRKDKYSLGIGTGRSLDYDHTHYWNTHTDYYDLQQESIKKKFNWNVELVGRILFKKWYLSLASGITQFSEQLDNAPEKNKLTYFHSTLVSYYSFIRKPWGNLSVGIGTGFKSLLNQKGTYINPNEISETSGETDFYPTSQNLWVLTARLESEIKLSDKLNFYPQIRYENHPTSITTTEHPILFWKDVIGVNASLSWTF